MLAAAELATAAAAVAYAQVSECEEEMRAKVRPDMVIEGRRGGERCDMAGLVEGKSFGVNPTRYAHPWGSLALVPVERRAREEMRARMKTVDAIDAARHAHVRPPPLRERVEGLGGLKVVTVGGFCEFNHVVHELVEQATRAIVGSRRMRGRGGGRGAQVRAVRTRLRRTLAAGAWADWHRALVARLQMIDPSPSQAALLMERRARKDGEAARRQAEAQAQRRVRHGVGLCAAGGGGREVGEVTGGAAAAAAAPAAAPAAAVAAARGDTDGEDERGVQQESDEGSGGTEAAAKSRHEFTAAPPCEDDSEVAPGGGGSDGGGLAAAAVAAGVQQGGRGQSRQEGGVAAGDNGGGGRGGGDG